VDKHYYTVAEANECVPALQDIFGRVIRLRSQLKTIYGRLDARKFAPTSDDFTPYVKGAPPEVLHDRATFKGLIELVKAEIAAVQDQGCVIKDIDTGLVDWFGKSGEDEVLLCWRFGEREVGFFHDLESGIAGRRPVSELLPPTLR
jgi:hypothetical protein